MEGGKFGARISTPSRVRCAHRRYSTGAISMTRRTWREPASVIMRSAVANVLQRVNRDPIDSGDLIRRRRYEALAAVAGNVSQAIAGSHRQAHHAAGYGHAAGGGPRGPATPGGMQPGGTGYRRRTDPGPTDARLRGSARTRGP